MNKEYIERLIYEYNPRLRNVKTEVPAFKRELYSEIMKWMGKKQIIAITGLRRTGKTTIMKQIMQNLDNPAFFSFDEEETQTKETLVFVIDYFVNVLKSSRIFLDEIHYVEDWQGVLKRYYDTKGLRFVISGSESLELKKARESLAGRIITFRLEPLEFREYLGMKGRTVPDAREYNALYRMLLPEKEFFEVEFVSYLYNGAFPEIIRETNGEVVRKYIGDLVVKKIIYRDIPRIFEIKRKDLLFSLFSYVCTNSANLFEIKNLCDTFKTDYETVSNYIFYLQESFLIKISEVYSKSAAKRLRRNKKIYVIHPSIAFAVLGYSKEMLIEKMLGQYVESLFGREFFWRDKHKNEVDVVIGGFPVEVKYANDITKEDMKGILRFMEVFKKDKGIIITKSTTGEKEIGNKRLYLIPAWLFLLAGQKNIMARMA